MSWSSGLTCNLTPEHFRKGLDPRVVALRILRIKSGDQCAKALVAFIPCVDQSNVRGSLRGMGLDHRTASATCPAISSGVAC